MARIVAAMAMTHSPGLTGWFTRAPEAYQQLALGATAEMRRRLEAARPDALVMFTNDHLLNWPINNIPEYAVGIGEEHVGPADWFDEWLGMGEDRVPGHPAPARGVVNEGAEPRRPSLGRAFSGCPGARPACSPTRRRSRGARAGGWARGARSRGTERARARRHADADHAHAGLRDGPLRVE